MFKKHFLLSVLKLVILLNSFLGFFDEKKFVRIAFIWKHFCNIINVFALTFDQLNASLQKKSSDFFKLKIPLNPCIWKLC